MKQSILSQISESIESIVRDFAFRLVHIGGDGIPFRSGIRIGDCYIITVAGSAEEGENVGILYKDGKALRAVVKGFDGATGLALLFSEEEEKLPHLEGDQPRLGMLVVTLAFPSPEGTEARLDLVRCSAGDYFQTDGSPFPGFGGSAVLSPEGKLLGAVISNSSGNRSSILPYSRLMPLVEKMKKHGSTKRRILGVRTQPVEGGLLVIEVSEGSAAKEAGILVGDILASIGGTELKAPPQLMETLTKSEGAVEITITRGGETRKLSATPSEQPDK